MKPERDVSRSHSDHPLAIDALPIAFMAYNGYRMPQSRLIKHVIPRVFAKKYAITPITMPSNPLRLFIVHNFRLHNSLERVFCNNIIAYFQSQGGRWYV